MSKTVLIVGGGITGATLAYRLSKAGWAVTVLDAGRPNATQASFGWINASFYLDAHHHRLRAMGIAAWKRLLAEVELDVAWSGCLCWDMPPEQLAETHTTLQRLGYEAALLETAEIAARTAVCVNRPIRRCGSQLRVPCSPKRRVRVCWMPPRPKARVSCGMWWWKTLWPRVRL